MVVSAVEVDEADSVIVVDLAIAAVAEEVVTEEVTVVVAAAVDTAEEIVEVSEVEEEAIEEDTEIAVDEVAVVEAQLSGKSFSFYLSYELCFKYLKLLSPVTADVTDQGRTR